MTSPRLATLAALTAVLLLVPVAAAQTEDGSPDLQPRPLGTVRGVAILAGDDGVSGLEPWRSDGTDRGTFLLADLCPGACSSALSPIAEAPEAGLLFFEASTPRRELWVTDGTAGGTRALARLGSRNGSGVWVAERRRLVFRATGPQGLEVWASDGTKAGTRPLADLVPGRAGSLPADFRAVDGLAYFVAHRPGVGSGLWASDGTPDGTRRVSELPPTGANRPAAVVGVAGSCVVYRRDLPGGAASVGSYCPGEGSRLLLPSLPPGQWQESLIQVADGGERLLLVVLTPETTVQLWSTDGTPGGTRRLHEEGGNFPLNGVGGAVALPDGRTVFRFFTAALGGEPWVTDGTPEGTRLLADLCPGPCSSARGMFDLVPVGDRVLLVAVGTAGGEELWSTDGTPEGTLPVADLLPGSDPGDVMPEIQGEAPHLFAISHLVTDERLWATDGTPAGTVDLGSFLDAGVIEVLAAGALLRATSRDGRGDLWWSDGTPAGTRPVDLAGVVQPAGCVADAEHLCLLDRRFRVSVDWRDPRSGDSGTAGVRPFPGSDRTGTFWFFDEANVELVLKMLDGRPVNGAFWTFYGALTDVEYWIDVEDVTTGWRRTYHNPPREICGRADTSTLEPVAVEAGAAFVPEATTAEPVPTTDVPSCDAAGVLCLHDDRFRLEVAWRDPRSGDTGTGTAIPGTDRSGYFWFFRDDNVELVAKVLDGTPVNGRWWVFWGALTDVGYELRVVDAGRLEERTYRNPAGNVCGGADTAAF